MSYYVSKYESPQGFSMDSWEITGSVAKRIDVPDPKTTSLGYFEALPGETIWASMKRQSPYWFLPGTEKPFAEMILRPGQFYPRMARPTGHLHERLPTSNPSVQGNEDFLAGACGQLMTLTRQLNRICQTIHPAQETFNTYGHDIRNLLILACTEVEMHWRGILEANSARPKNNKRDYSTEDYVLLREAMKLEEYGVTFPDYPWLGPFRPFESWNGSGPTKTLPWYDAYNAVKHNRESEFNKATLFCVFHSICACAVMILAQFGVDWRVARAMERGAYIYPSTSPDWPVSEHYYHRYDLGVQNPTWTQRNFKF